MLITNNVNKLELQVILNDHEHSLVYKNSTSFKEFAQLIKNGLERSILPQLTIQENNIAMIIIANTLVILQQWLAIAGSTPVENSELPSTLSKKIAFLLLVGCNVSFLKAVSLQRGKLDFDTHIFPLIKFCNPVLFNMDDFHSICFSNKDCMLIHNLIAISVSPQELELFAEEYIKEGCYIYIENNIGGFVPNKEILEFYVRCLIDNKGVEGTVKFIWDLAKRELSTEDEGAADQAYFDLARSLKFFYDLAWYCKNVSSEEIELDKTILEDVRRTLELKLRSFEELLNHNDGELRDALEEIKYVIQEIRSVNFCRNVEGKELGLPKVMSKYDPRDKILPLTDVCMQRVKNLVCNKK
ncbi:MAG: hypothetical protein QWI36_01870 [Wolbachia endosymbiont of Tyrophagus putrescentiae]|nr:hypothetical protein [Wolbachia endosymbiont of Tyrophagus putrescentiae]